VSGPIVFVSAILEIVNPWEVLSVNFELTLGRDIAFTLIASVRSWSCYYVVDPKKIVLFTYYLMYMIRSMRYEPLMKIGASFGLNRYSSPSSAVMLVKRKLQKDRKFKNHLEHNHLNIIKGMNPRASSGLKRKLASLAPLTTQRSCEEFFD
jgi:hypothetical protein